jgi:hypothetical protein
MMNWEAAAAIAEILSAVAVVVSLIYVAKELKNNSRAQQAAAGFNASTRMSDLNQVLSTAMIGEASYQAGGEAQFTNTVSKVYDPNTDPETLSPTDALLIAFINRTIFQNIEGEYYLYQHGFLDREQWLARKAWARGYLELPVNKKWWEQEMTQAVYRPEFTQVINEGEHIQVKNPDARR